MSRCIQHKEFPKDVNRYANRYRNTVPLYPCKTVLYAFLLQSRKTFTMLFRPLPQHFNLQESLTQTGFATSFPGSQVLSTTRLAFLLELQDLFDLFLKRQGGRPQSSRSLAHSEQNKFLARPLR